MTEEFHPGFRNSTASYTVSLLQPKVIADMRLARARPARSSSGRSPTSCRRTTAAISSSAAAWSARRPSSRSSRERDAEALPAYYAALERVADVLRDLALQDAAQRRRRPARRCSPPRAQGRRLARHAARRAARRARPVHQDRRATFLDGWFESDAVKAAFGFDAVVGNYASPDTPGSAYVLLHHVFGEVNGKKGAWGHAIGGMGAITQAMAEACVRGWASRSASRRRSPGCWSTAARRVGVRLEVGRGDRRGRSSPPTSGPRCSYDQLIDRGRPAGRVPPPRSTASRPARAPSG